MAYKKSELFELAMKEAEDRNLFFIEDLVSFLPCDKSTFYTKFPIESDEYHTIRARLEANKVKTKSAIRHRLFNMDNPTAQLALYRMIATPEERDAIVMSKTDITSAGEKLAKEPLTIEIIDSRDKVDTDSEI